MRRHGHAPRISKDGEFEHAGGGGRWGSFAFSLHFTPQEMIYLSTPHAPPPPPPPPCHTALRCPIYDHSHETFLLDFDRILSQTTQRPEEAERIRVRRGVLRLLGQYFPRTNVRRIRSSTPACWSNRVVEVEEEVTRSVYMSQRHTLAPILWEF